MLLWNLYYPACRKDKYHFIVDTACEKLVVTFSVIENNWITYLRNYINPINIVLRKKTAQLFLVINFVKFSYSIVPSYLSATQIHKLFFSYFHSACVSLKLVLLLFSNLPIGNSHGVKVIFDLSKYSRLPFSDKKHWNFIWTQ